MSLLGKKASKKGNEEIHLRKKYSDPSNRFASWVNTLGLEKSVFGRLAMVLEKKFSVRKITVLFLFSLLLSSLIYMDFDTPGEYRVGEIVPADIKSPIAFDMVDEVATEAKRVEAEKNLPLILDHDREVYEPVYSRIYKSFRELRKLAKATKWPKSRAKREVMVKDFFRHQSFFNESLGIEVPDRVFEWLVQYRFSVRVENILVKSISQWSEDVLVDLPESVGPSAERQLLIREISTGSERKESSSKLEDVRNVRVKSLFTMNSIRGYRRLNKHGKQMLEKLAHSLLVANSTLNKQEMAERQQKARDAVLPVQISIKKNQTIVVAGNPVKPIHLMILDEIREVRSSQRTEFLVLFSALLFVLVVIVSFGFLNRFSRQSINVDNKDLGALAIITLVVVILCKTILFLTETALLEKFGTTIPQSAFLFFAPVATGTMLAALLIMSAEVVWIFTLFLSVVTSAMMGFDVSILVVTMVAGIAAAQAVFSCSSRNDIYLAGFKTGLVKGSAIFLVYVIANVGEPGLLYELLWVVSAGLVSGTLAAALTLMIIPFIESKFHYTTDIKLLELSSLNHPLMQEMMMKAPGTYHHCMAVGNMVDAAARKIGANPLMAKVMAYYHDIGKTEHAQYFIENQRPGHNPHNHISPHMSKTILIAHVKDGAEMAILHKLGKPIVDGILQHHGTSLIGYFYNRALEEQDEDVTGNVEESDFRYPGPKPQFREAALCMLADSIEATARSLDEPTQHRLNAIVENIIENKFMDGQLDECNLTIEDLAVIKISFKKMLQAIYHQRMDYPHMKDGKLVAAEPKKGNKKGTA